MAFFDEGEDVAGGFIDGGAASVEAGLGDGDVRSPGEARIGWERRARMCSLPQGGDEGSFFGDDDVGVAFRRRRGFE